MANLLGDGFSNYVRRQINNRQKLHGKQNRTSKELSYLNSRSAWVKLVSGVSIDNSRLKMLGLEGIFPEGLDLAKEFILFNGTSKVKTKKDGSDGKIIQREGITTTNKNPNSNNFAYGLGGTDFGIVPMPGIVDLNVNHAGTRGSLRKATITIKAYNKQQLDIIDALYLRLGFTVLIEFGHSHYIDNNDEIVNLHSTLLEEKFFNSTLNKKTYLQLLPLIEKKRFETGGNYDALFGRITNFKWSFNPDGTYNISLDVYSLGDLAESLKISHPGTGRVNNLSRNESNDPTYGHNIVNDYLHDIRSYHKYRFTPEAEIDTPVPESKEDDEPEGEYIVEEGTTEPTKINTLISIVDTIFFQDQIKENNILITDEKSIKDEVSGELIYYVKYDNKWFFKSRIAELAGKWEIIQKEDGSYGRVKIKKDESDIRWTGWEKIQRAAGNNLLNVTDNLGLIELLGWDQTYKIIDQDAIDKTGMDFRKNMIAAQIEGGVGITDYTGGGANTPVINTENISADLKFLEQQSINEGTTLDLSDIEEVVDNSAQITNPSIAATKEEFDRNQRIAKFMEELEDIRGKQDIFYQIGDIYDDSSIYEKFGRILNHQASWSEKQPNGKFLYPQDSGAKYDERQERGEIEGTDILKSSLPTADIIKLGYKPESLSFYIRFGTFLDFLREKVLYKIGDDSDNENDIPNTPIIDIDTDAISNIMYTLPNQISLDQKVCVVNNDFVFQDLYIRTFDGLEEFQTKVSEAPYYGKIMNIYLNFSFIEGVMRECTTDDLENSVYLYDALSTICLSINQALGGINNLEPVIDEKTNCLKIIDSSRLPNVKKVADYLNELNPEKYSYPTDLKNFNYNKHTLPNGSIKYNLNLYGFDVKDNSSNFIHNIDMSTSVTKNMSTMLAIGAASKGGYVVGEESTMFSKWNEGIHDRFNEPILNADGTEINNSSSFQQSWNKARVDYGNFIINNFYKSNTGEFYPYWGMTDNSPQGDGSIGVPPTTGILDDNLIIQNLAAGTEFYRMLMTSASIANNKSLSGQPGFLPINLQLNMDGISGIKIYEKVNVDISFLPTNYPETLDFLSTGLSHLLKDNKWETTLSTQATSIGAFKNTQPLPEIFSINSALEDLDIVSLVGGLTGEYDDSGYDIPIGCPPPDTQQLDFVIENQQEAEFNLYDKAQKLLSRIFTYEKNHKGSKGLCARYVKNLAKKFFEEWNKGEMGDKSIYSKESTAVQWVATAGLFTKPQSGTQDAKSKLTHDNLVSNFGYKSYRIGKGIHKGDLYGTNLRKIIKSIDLFPGDIIAYWDTSNTEGGEKGYQLYGHIQMYVGTGHLGKDTFLSDFAHSSFVYGGMNQALDVPRSNPDSCWNLILLKSPLNPLKAVPKPSTQSVSVNIGERAQNNIFSPTTKF